MSKLTTQIEYFRKISRTVNGRLDAFLSGFSSYAVLIAVAVASVVALFLWKPQYAEFDALDLDIQVGEVQPQTDREQDPRLAFAALSGKTSKKYFDTDISEAPFWISFTTPQTQENTPMMVEFPSRHSLSVACWDAVTFNQLGDANRDTASGKMSQIKAGFALEISPPYIGQQLLCLVRSIGPARISALWWRSADLQTSALEFHRTSGLLDGGVIILGVFVLITALINRSSLYLLFAA